MNIIIISKRISVLIIVFSIFSVIHIIADIQSTQDRFCARNNLSSSNNIFDKPFCYKIINDDIITKYPLKPLNGEFYFENEHP
jgi:hypothetical protein